MTRDYRTKEEVIRMLLTSTGQHFLDSGDAYGRNWQRHQAAAKTILGLDETTEVDLSPGSADLARLVRVFDERAVVHIDWCHGEPDVTVNTYHFVIANLTFDTQRQEWFRAFVEWSDRNHGETAWLGYAEDFPQWLGDQWVDECGRMAFVDFEVDVDTPFPHDLASADLPDDYDPSGIAERWSLDQLTMDDKLYLGVLLDYRNPEIGGYFDGGSDEKPLMVNTYNGECFLDQTLQYVAFSVDGDRVVLLQIHGGCDVRGGYGEPRFMVDSGNSEYGITEVSRGDLVCRSDVEDDGSPHYWTFDDASTAHAGYQGCWGGSRDRPSLTGPTFDMTDPDNEAALQFICRNLLPGSPTTFDPHRLWLHLRNDVIPAKLDLDTEEGPAVPSDDPVERRALELYQGIIASMMKYADSDERMGVLFHTDNVGYCPVCGGRLAFYPTALL